ncbi:hypothetical protein L3i20_v228790 [Paenibacillus sp. L3-i20]|nr:hypothetical protein L3i20_v228790 [Paenibacillus sp. L3-i20]
MALQPANIMTSKRVNIVNKYFMEGWPPLIKKCFYNYISTTITHVTPYNRNSM